jgi:hypothetical protein
MYCKKCGAKLEKGKKYCSSCSEFAKVEYDPFQLINEEAVQAPKEKKKFKNKFIGVISCISVILVIMAVFTLLDCSGLGNANALNSAEALKKFLDEKPANSLENPINVVMNVNDLMIADVAEAISSAGKFVTLDLSRSSGLTAIDGAFKNNKALTGIILPDSVTRIRDKDFHGCLNLTKLKWTEMGTDSSLIGTWESKDAKKEIVFTKEFFEFSGGGKQPKGFYYITDDTVNFIITSGEIIEMGACYIKDNKLAWGYTIYIKQE